ncbi:MAG: DUF898 family protein [Spirochaetia bacterium]|jgi:uncharacterized membrane protein YjgN (DUF898 family)
MKTNFDFTLKGADWWKPFLGFWVLFLVIYVLDMMMSIGGASRVGHFGVYLLLLFVFMLLLLIIQAIFTIVFLRIMLPKLSIGGKSFSFRGDIGKYLGMNVVGLLLSLVTLTIYVPWYARRITAYLISETTFDGVSPAFLGKGGKLFKYFLLGLWIPVIVLCVIIAVALGIGIARGGAAASSANSQLSASLVTFLTMIVIFIIIVPFMYLMYKWYANIRWNDVAIAWQTSFWPSCGFILGQMLLTVITAGIYWPAALLRMARYFAAKTVFSKGDAEIGRLGFEGDIGRGFGLLWGQTLLSIITLGIYIPWATANIGRWLAAATIFDSKELSAEHSV